MIDFIVYDLVTGDALRWGRVPNSIVAMQAQAGEGVIEAVYPNPGERCKVVDGKVVLVEIKDQVPDYRELRRKAYPNIGDQLDAILKGGDHLDALRERVRDIKTMYPKP